MYLQHHILGTHRITHALSLFVHRCMPLLELQRICWGEGRLPPFPWNMSPEALLELWFDSQCPKPCFGNAIGKMGKYLQHHMCSTLSAHSCMPLLHLTSHVPQLQNLQRIEALRQAVS